MAETAIITNRGLELIAQAAGSASAVQISRIALGDGGGANYAPDFEDTGLRGEFIRRDIDRRVQVEMRTWLVRAVFAADDLPDRKLREIGFFAADGTLIVVVAGVDFRARDLGGFDYIVEHALNFDRAAEGRIEIVAPDWEIFDHAVINLETQARLMDADFALNIRNASI